MALRRASFTRPWLKSLAISERRESFFSPQWIVHRREYATTLDPVWTWTPQLRQLLVAIHARDCGSISKSFLDWTDALEVGSPKFDSTVAEEVKALPHTTISEIVRNLDPIAHPELDLAHGLRITIGQTQYVDVAEFADEFGIRPTSRRILKGMHNLLQAKGCPADDDGLLTHDIEVMMRCAGTAANKQAAITFFGQAPRLKGSSGRNSRTIREFLKAMFALEPAYHQFDDTKIMLRGRDIVRGTNFDKEAIEGMDKVRFSLNALLREPWEREETHLGVRKQRYGRNRTLDRWAFRMQYAHWRAQGVNIDEEFICAVLLGFSRSFALDEIIEKVFKARYGLEIGGSRETKTVEGGTVFPPGHPLRPTHRFLHAIVDALGVMGQIPFCLSLVDYFSRTYELPVTHELWSKILNWAYINSSKPIITFRRKLGPDQEHLRSSTAHVREIISMMTSEPFNISLSFDDSIIFAKALIVDSDLEGALHVVRERLIPHYEARVKEHQQAIVDEVLRTEAAPFSSLASSYRRQRAEVLLDHTWHRVQHVIDRLIKQVSNYKKLVEDPKLRNLIPDLVNEFGSFLSKNVRYRTEQGLVTLWRPDDDPGVSRVVEVVETDRQMLPAIHTKVFTPKQRQQEFQDLLVAEMLTDGQRSLLEEQIAMDEARTPEERAEVATTDGRTEEGRLEARSGGTAAVSGPAFYTMTERRSVRQFTRIPAKRGTDFALPPVGAPIEELEMWRARVLRELTL